MTERERFEAWVVRNFGSERLTKRALTDKYQHETIEVAWMAWQARARLDENS